MLQAQPRRYSSDIRAIRDDGVPINFLITDGIVKFAINHRRLPEPMRYWQHDNIDCVHAVHRLPLPD